MVNYFSWRFNIIEFVKNFFIFGIVMFLFYFCDFVNVCILLIVLMMIFFFWFFILVVFYCYLNYIFFFNCIVFKFFLVFIIEGC